VDHFFRSLAENDGDNAIGIVLSGNGSDGTLGVREIKGHSGMVMAQEPASARHEGMPSSAIATGLVDYVLRPEEMPALLERYVREKRRRSPGLAAAELTDPEAQGLQRVLSVLRERTGGDFSAYKQAPVRRRIDRRMAVHGIESLREYAELIEQSSMEAEALFRELLVCVTRFFRDPDAFTAMLEALRALVEHRSDGQLRIWVPGCGTGEEAYSLAIQNLLDSTEIATVFLDTELVIRRFTTQARRLFNLIEADVGRPIADLTANLRYSGLVEDAREVLRSLVFREREVQTREGAWRLMRIIPYGRHDGLIDGLVIRFVDIDRLKKAEESAQAARSCAEGIADAVNVPLVVLDDGFRVVSANRSFYETFRAVRKAVVGELFSALFYGRWNSPDSLRALAEVISGERAMDSQLFRFAGPEPDGSVARLSARRLTSRPGHTALVLLAVEGTGGYKRKMRAINAGPGGGGDAK
jgi:PAS domain-containing protein